MARGAPINVRIRVDSDAAVAGLRASRRDLNKSVARGMGHVAETVAAPEVRQRAPGQRIARQIRGGATSSRAYVEGRHPATGVLNFGGVVRGVIRPKHKGGALRTPWGPRAVVRGPRHYTGTHFMEKGVEHAVTSGRALEQLADAAAAPYRAHLGSGSVIG